MNAHVKPMYRLMLVVFLVWTQAFAQTQNVETVKYYLSQQHAALGLQPADYAELYMTRSYAETNSPIERCYVQQKKNGLDVVGGSFSYHINRTTQAHAGTSNLLPLHLYQAESPHAQLQPLQAAKQVLEHLGTEAGSLQIKQQPQGTEQKTLLSRSPVALWDVPVRLAYLPDEKLKKLRLVWEVQVYDYSKQHYWVAYLDDKTGKIARKVDLVLHCQFDGAATDRFHTNHNHKWQVTTHEQKSNFAVPFSTKGVLATNNAYRVYDMPYEAPTDAGATHSMVQGKENNLASPDGWHRVANSLNYNYTRGNNVFAFWDPSPGPLGGAPNPLTAAQSNGGPLGTPNLAEPYTFDYPINLNQQPDAYRNAAIVNLFYWNNLVHDVYYQFGFTEEAGNFQSAHTFSTGTRGGSSLPNDEVWAQAQDGGGTNNANFLTLPDGINGQMQMYLWTAALPDSLVQIRTSSSGIPPAGTKYYAIQGSFNSVLTINLHTDSVANRQIVIVQSNPLSTVGDSTEGCTTGQQGIALPPANDVSGKIVLIDRGNCSFVEKVFGAQLGGAAGVIIINNVDGPPIAMGGTDGTANLITIPAVMISKADGEILKSQIRSGAVITGSLKQDNPPAPMRDGDLDNGVIAHEYGHGISNRLTGGPMAVGPLGGDEQGGEGWSDFIALHMITRSNDLLPSTAEHPNGRLPHKGIGTYVVYQDIATGGGIRPTPYSTDLAVNPALFKDIAKGGEITVPHGVGYIWCSMLYDMMQAFIDQYGFNDDIYNAANPDGTGAPAAGSGGNNIAMRLVMEGMKVQPTAPTFEQQRNAILQADTLLYGARHSCMIWKTFARRGLGYSARSGSNALGDEVQGFDLPQTCAPNQVRLNVKLHASERADNNAMVNYIVSVKNMLPSAVNNIIVEDSIPEGTSFVSASDGGSISGNKVIWNLASIAAQTTKDLTLQLSVNLPQASEQVFFTNHETTLEFAPDAMPDTWQLVARDAYSGTHTWYAREVENPVHNVTLTQVSQVAIPAEGAKLSFYHKYNTEKNFDGGVVEISNDNGASWTYLTPTSFEKNGYNSIIATVDNPNIGLTDLAAFSGATNGYINSIADLGDYAGQQVKVRFRYTCDVASLASGTDPGWYVDDVYILKNLTSITNHVRLGLQSGNENLFDSTGNQPLDSAVTIIFDNNPLPVSMPELAASAKANHIRLSWKIYLPAAGDFEIERRAANENDFTRLAVVKPQSNSQSQFVYSDEAVKPGIYYYYRLKQTDPFGMSEYSNTAVAKLKDDTKEPRLEIMPNPAKSYVYIIISNSGEKGGLVRISDAMGKPITTFKVASAAAVQRHEINVSMLPAGTYWVEWISDGVKRTRQMVVAK